MRGTLINDVHLRVRDALMNDMTPATLPKTRGIDRERWRESARGRERERKRGGGGYRGHCSGSLSQRSHGAACRHVGVYIYACRDREREREREREIS